jgi:hypothetical protein
MVCLVYLVIILSLLPFHFFLFIFAKIFNAYQEINDVSAMG